MSFFLLDGRVEVFSNQKGVWRGGGRAMFWEGDVRGPISLEAVAFGAGGGSSLLGVHGDIIIVNSSMSSTIAMP